MTVGLSADSLVAGSYNTEIGGQVLFDITDDLLKEFGIDDTKIREGTKTILGLWPTDYSFSDPTDHGDIFAAYDWKPTQVLLFPLSATVKQFNVEEVHVETRTAENTNAGDSKVNLAFLTNVENSYESNWSQTSTIEVSESIEVGIELFGSATTTLKYAQAWQKGGAEVKTISVGSSTTIDVTLEDDEKAWATNVVNIGTATVEVVYVACLIGGILANYKKPLNGHHYWYVPINAICVANKIINMKKIVQEIKLKSYENTSTIFGKGDPPSDKSEHVHVHPNTPLYIGADPLAPNPEGIRFTTVRS